ncbi:GAF domain-containing protein [Methylobacterium durans]|uniref:GAF domain-containing protein n=1 Tax=Methylobacterium durans TaxID=2202825 RepID=A0A2U8W5A5_9HYPH|nr:GAF domain-containing protein [Methylobacterium durans]AWN41239.1 GAF domain-containing protein [Methylobacterium durans]
MFDDQAQLDLRLERVGERLAAARSLDDVVAALGQSARLAIACDGIAVVLRDDGCCNYVAEDAIQMLWKGQRFPLEACVSGWAMLNAETAVVPDVSFDPRVPVAPYQNKAIRSLVMAPIGSPEPVAALGAYWCALTFLDEGTVARVEAVAGLATEALARIQTGSTQLSRRQASA